MKLSELSIKRPVTTTMMVLLAVLLGVISLTRLNLDLYPQMTYPGAAIIVEYGEVGPEEVENMVTKPLEGAIATVTNISSLTSTSSTGQSIIVAEFNWGTDMDQAVMDMREKIDLIQDYLPDEVGNPIIIKFDPSLIPIMQMGIASDLDLVQLKKVVEDNVVPALERLEGVAQVSLLGGKEREILVSIDQTRLNSYNIGFDAVKNALMMENMNLSGGNVYRGSNKLLVRVTGKFNSIDEIRDILVATPGGLVPLDNIARVEDTFKEMDTISRLNGKSSITLTIQKQTDANTVTVSRLVREELDRISKELEYDLEIVPIMDQAEFIEDSISNVGRNAVIGGLLAVIILFLFLRNIRSTIVIATAIPVSVITTFMLLYFGDLTLNMMTLGGLALGVGMLVDNSIVVLENIYRYRAEGLGRFEAASLGSQEVGMAITASTITTAIVFLPVVFVGGLASQLFKELALTVTFSLLASLLVSLTLIPVMSSKILKVSQKDLDRSKKGLMEWLKNHYQSSLNWALSHRWLVVTITIAVLAGTLALTPMLGMEFIPQMDQGMLSVTAQLPLGTSLEESDRVARQIEEELLSFPEVKSLLTNVGSEGNMMGTGGKPETISMYLQLVDLEQRERSAEQIAEAIRQKLNIPDVELSVGTQGMGLGVGGSPVSIIIKGNDLAVLEELAVKVRNQLAQIEGIREIEDNISEGRPELQIRVNRSLAAHFGLRISQIGSTVKTAISGTTATRYEIGGEEYDIRIKLDREDIDNVDQVKNLLLPSPGGACVPLARVAEFTVEKGPKEILRENQTRYARVTADLYNTDLRTVMPQIQARIKENIELPEGYRLEYGGDFQDMQESFVDLFFAFLLAIVLVYMVMASQFESLLHPFVVMFTVPLAIIGVILGLVITGYKLSVVSIMGVIMLAGIVVNNAIVLVDYINTLRNRGLGLREAILEAGPVRLRPIMMTALTTILGLAPLALGIGEGAEIQAPMAVVVIGGLAIATLLTLYVVPVIYSLLTGLSNRITARFGSSGKSART